jgi:hypothetical protein
LAANLFKKFFRYNEPDAVRRAATARVLAVIFQIVTVIEGDFLARIDVAQGANPNPAPDKFRHAIGRTAMIDTAGDVPLKIAVEIELVVEREDAPVLQFATAGRFLLGDFLAHIFNHLVAGVDVGRGEHAFTVNPGRVRFDAFVHQRGSVMAPRKSMAPL